jgi:hypothetical protein
MRRFVFSAALLAALSAASTASAQNSGLVFLVDGGITQPSGSLSQSFSLTKNAESAPVTTSATLKRVTFFDLGARFRIAGPISLGIVGFSATGKADGTVSAKIPHPFFFNTFRDISGNLSGLDRKETGAHFELAYVAPLGRKLQLTVFGGPSYFQVEQALVNDVTYTDAYPYDTATFSSATTKTVKKTKTGVNGGVDLTFKMSRAFGVAGIVRYAAASVPMSVGTGTDVTVKAGGLQLGGGLRMAF